MTSKLYRCNFTAMRDYTRKRGWEITVEVKDLSDQERRSGQKREELLAPREKAGHRPSLSSGGLIVGDDPLVDLVNTVQNADKLGVAQQMLATNQRGRPASTTAQRLRGAR